MKDLFSKQAQDYAKYRPTYPLTLFEYLSSLPSQRKTTWDAATGNGQAAVMLAPHFESVVATDLSEKQLANAEKHPKVHYAKATSENSGLPSQSVNLTTVAQAFHWFDAPKFAEEVKRVSTSNAYLAVWCYSLAKISPKVDELVLHYYQDILGNYWEPEREKVETGYQTISLPFFELQTPSFSMQVEWELSHWLGYLATWSAYRAYVEKNGTDPLPPLVEPFTKAWPKEKAQIQWDLALRVWKIS